MSVSRAQSLPRFALAASVLFCLTPWSSPGLALAIGVALALSLGNPWPSQVTRVSRPLLQVSVVLLGFGMNLSALAGAARQGFELAALSIGATFLLGAMLGRLLRVQRSTSTLVSAGTAICGGSAIAAVGLAITAAEGEMSVALGTVFLLNGVALYVFPPLGHLLGLSQVQFGVWAGIAIHDVSSVVGAASTYGAVALQTATAVKLSRTLWIIPVALAAGLMARRPEGGQGRNPQVRIAVPWFVGLFVLASLSSTWLGPVHRAAPVLTGMARTGMTLTLLLVGVSLSRASLARVGIRPVLHGLALWLVVSGGSLAVLRWLGTR